MAGDSWGVELWTVAKNDSHVRCLKVAEDSWFVLRFVHVEKARVLRRAMFTSEAELFEEAARALRRFLEKGWREV